MTVFMHSYNSDIAEVLKNERRKIHEMRIRLKKSCHRQDWPDLLNSELVK